MTLKLPSLLYLLKNALIDTWLVAFCFFDISLFLLEGEMRFLAFFRNHIFNVDSYVFWLVFQKSNFQKNDQKGTFRAFSAKIAIFGHF